MCGAFSSITRLHAPWQRGREQGKNTVFRRRIDQFAPRHVCKANEQMQHSGVSACNPQTTHDHALQTGSVQVPRCRARRPKCIARFGVHVDLIKPCVQERQTRRKNRLQRCPGTCDDCPVDGREHVRCRCCQQGFQRVKRLERVWYGIRQRKSVSKTCHKIWYRQRWIRWAQGSHNLQRSTCHTPVWCIG